jgi:LPXTG-motif cell wall-anchored protein
MKKLMKRVLALAASLVMVIAMAVPAMAAEETPTDTKGTTITISDANGPGTYYAYQLLKLNSYDKDKNTYDYAVNSKYKNAIIAGLQAVDSTVSTDITDAEIIKKIAGFDSDQMRTFSDEVWSQVKDLTPDYQTDGDKNTLDVSNGYYLIAEVTNTKTNPQSLVMVDTKTDDTLTITTKEDTPKSEKFVKETNDTTATTSDWQKAADYDIGDMVPFKLVATLPNNYEDYDNYMLNFVDTPSAGFDLPTSISAVYLADANGNKITDFASNDYTTELTQRPFRISFSDLKKTTIASQIKNSYKIIVEYSMQLNDSAKIGNPGNPNEFYLEYTNKPYNDGKGDKNPGTTPPDTTVVFTYKVTVDKVDKNNDALAGASFALYKVVNGEEKLVKEYPAGTMTEFTFSGLDAGSYVLKELDAPKGYQKVEDYKFEIVATYDKDSGTTTLTALTVNGTLPDNVTLGKITVGDKNEDANIPVTVVNITSGKLPSTGGIGTTIFYLVGGILVAGAAIVLIAKKRRA